MRLSKASAIKRGKGVLALVIQAAVCGLAVLLMFVPASELPSAYALSAGLALLLGWSIASWKLTGRELFDPYCIFLISAFMFNAGHGLLEVTGVNNSGILSGDFSESIVRQTLLTSFIGLAALHFGALFTVSVRQTTRGELRWASMDRETWIRKVGWVLVFIAVPATAIWLRQTMAIVAATGYASLYDRDFGAGIAATPFVLSGFLVPAALFLTASGRRHVRDRRVGAAIIFIFATLQFYIGYRSTAAMPLIAWMWLHHRLIKPLRGSVILSGAMVLVFIVFPLVRETRNMSATERSTESYLANFVSVDNPAISSIHEMGSSMATTAHTIALVPSIRPFDWGAGYGYAILTLFPNLFWDIHPTIARGTATDWLVQSINPIIAARGGAYGFSFIAEAYLNFGQPGVVAVMAIYGILLVSIILWAEKSGDPAKLALLATILAFSLRFPRDELAGIIRPIVWYGILPYVSAVILPVVLGGALKTRSVRTPRCFKRVSTEAV